MVWTRKYGEGKIELVFVDSTLNARQYINEILEPHVLLYTGAIGAQLICIQDNAISHCAKVTQDYLNEQAIVVMDWRACSPDMNPIEHIWDQLKRATYSRMDRNSTLQNLRIIVEHEWANIPQRKIAKLVHSMRKRCLQCIKSHCGYIPY